KVQVSVGGGVGPVWSADGSQLYYAAGNAIVQARLAISPGLRVVSRDTVFRRAPNNTGGFGEANYDVSPDRSRNGIPTPSPTAYPLVVVPNWRAELRERMAASRH